MGPLFGPTLAPVWQGGAVESVFCEPEVTGLRMRPESFRDGDMAISSWCEPGLFVYSQSFGSLVIFILFAYDRGS